MIEKFVTYSLTTKRFSYVDILAVLVVLALLVAFALVFLGAVDQNLDHYSGSH